jgi:hypothetical protein
MFKSLCILVLVLLVASCGGASHSATAVVVQTPTVPTDWWQYHDTGRAYVLSLPLTYQQDPQSTGSDAHGRWTDFSSDTTTCTLTVATVNNAAENYLTTIEQHPQWTVFDANNVAYKAKFLHQNEEVISGSKCAVQTFEFEPGSLFPGGTLDVVYYFFKNHTGYQLIAEAQNYFSDTAVHAAMTELMKAATTFRLL